MNRISRPKRDRSVFPTESDIKIVSVLRGQDEGLSWTTIEEETGLSTKTISKRLKILWEKGIVLKRFIDYDSHPVYVLNGSISPTKVDAGIVYESIESFNFIRSLYKLTDCSAGDEADAADLLPIYYSRLYPFFLWCLHYGSRVETAHAEEAITSIYLNELRRKISGTIHVKRREQALKKLIAYSWNELKENELKKEAAIAERIFVSNFPHSLRDLAFGFFHFYLNKRIDSGKDIKKEFKRILEYKSVRMEFENYIGKKVPRYRLERFWNAFFQKKKEFK